MTTQKVSYYQTQEKEFEWKHPAKDFIKELKKKAKRDGLRIKTKLLPITSFVSSTAFHETRTVGYVVRWFFKP